ncbi:MAG: hypothetical protein IKJ78_06075 [Bacteroidales bacterium]|nr:hypothetical protein [Bacteroidales bacterium]
MYWSDILLLMLSATLANHLGLVEAVEGVLRHKIPVLNCSKCASFWLVLLCSLLSGQPLIASVAVSFLCAYAAMWLELLYGYIDTLYNRLYESIYPKEADDTTDTQG